MLPGGYRPNHTCMSFHNPSASKCWNVNVMARYIGLEDKSYHCYDVFFHAHFEHFQLIATWMKIDHIWENVNKSNMCQQEWFDAPNCWKLRLFNLVRSNAVCYLWSAFRAICYNDAYDTSNLHSRRQTSSGDNQSSSATWICAVLCKSVQSARRTVCWGWHIFLSPTWPYFYI